MEQILNILKSDPCDINLEELKQRVEEFYRNNGRHSYSKISAFIYNCEKGDIEYITENLNNLYQIMTRAQSEYVSNVSKLVDHIELEDQRESHIQEIYMDSIQKKMSIQRKITKAEFERQKYDLDKKLKDNKDNLEIEYRSQRQKIEGLNNNIVSVLGIFGAIIMAFFGGLSFLGGVLDNMHNVSAYRLSFIGALYLIGLFNIIFLLFYCISKIIEKPIHSNQASIKNCKKCTKNHNPKCILEKYSLVAYFNLIGIALLGNIFILYIIDKFNICAQIIESIGWNSQNGLLILSIGAFIYSLFIILGYYICKNIKRKYDDLFTSCSNNNCSEIENVSSMSSNFEVAAD